MRSATPFRNDERLEACTPRPDQLRAAFDAAQPYRCRRRCGGRTRAGDGDVMLSFFPDTFDDEVLPVFARVNIALTLLRRGRLGDRGDARAHLVFALDEADRLCISADLVVRNIRVRYSPGEDSPPKAESP